MRIEKDTTCRVDCDVLDGGASVKNCIGIVRCSTGQCGISHGPIAVAVSAATAASGYSVDNKPKERTVVHQKPKLTKRRKNKCIAQRRKNSTYNYAAAKNHIDLDPSASYHEVRAAVKPVAGLTPPKSPDKSQLKQESKILRKDAAREQSKRGKLKREITKIKKKADRKHA